MKKILPLLVLAFSFASHANAQERLEPAASIYEMLQRPRFDQEAYFQHVKQMAEALKTEEGATLYARYISDPYGPYIFEIIILRGQWYIVCKNGVLKKNNTIFLGSNWAEIEQKKLPLAQHNASYIIDLFRSAALAARFPAQDHIDGYDGTTHWFTVMEKTHITGRIWSPRAGSNTNRLVGICRTIRKTAEETEPGEELRVSEELLEEIIELRDTFKALR